MRRSNVLAIALAVLLLPWGGLYEAWACGATEFPSPGRVAETVGADMAGVPALGPVLAPLPERTHVERCERPPAMRARGATDDMPTLDRMRRGADLVRHAVARRTRVPPGASLPRVLDPPRSH